jgi:ElaB/YqjD/DUF883 family membrane-anchored ribosome-binding protein
MDGQSQVSGLKDRAQEVQDKIGDAAQGLMETAADAGARAQNMARDAGQRATAAAETMYGAGSDVADLVEGVVRQNPWASLLVAMAAGYGLACLVKQR